MPYALFYEGKQMGPWEATWERAALHRPDAAVLGFIGKRLRPGWTVDECRHPQWVPIMPEATVTHVPPDDPPSPILPIPQFCALCGERSGGHYSRGSE